VNKPQQELSFSLAVDYLVALTKM